MQVRIYFDGLNSQSIFDIMHSMLDAELYLCILSFKEDDYEWVIGPDVWNRIASNIQEKPEDPIYKIFGIEVTISKNERNTIILRNKIERRNEMPVEGVSYFDYSCIFKVKTRFIPAIKNVIFNEPATIVFWEDGSKTVVKCQDGDIYDPEKGLAMAISKKALGNQGNYCNEFKKWLPEDESELSKNLEGLASKIFSNKEK